LLKGTDELGRLESDDGSHAAVIEKLPAKFGRMVANLCQQAWCPRWQAQDDPGSPSVRTIPFLPAEDRSSTDRPGPILRISRELRAWTLTGGQRCHHELR
jgi:hypothetical protein